ncbi:hypothetical protein, partial [Bradyrhizobium sp.]|uniref:hypothetical protein n=1 Tax=Bradyrhizobium sp. TaxID=376 RepID=UPI003C479C16
KNSVPPALPQSARRARQRKQRLLAPFKLIARAPRATVHPRRALSSFWRGTRGPRTRVLLALGRAVPERDREEFFLGLHREAEKRYVPTKYRGEILVFYGDGLYEEPTLGWDSLGTVTSYAAPGGHAHNRQLMHEPAVSFVAKRLHDYLRGNA